MQHEKKLSVRDINGDLRIYFNFSANALVPFNPTATDTYLRKNESTILKVAQKLLKKVNFTPSPIYRGILIKENVDTIEPHPNFRYLSFSTERSVAAHFADVKGFGSEIRDLENDLGKFGYVIEYRPKLSEILFHYHFFSILPYAEAFTLLGMDGVAEVKSLQNQKEIMILQPDDPFTNITKMF